MPEGKLIVVEGTDGSGKTTQFNLLVERLRREGREPETLDFPRYGEPSAYFIEKYLNGGYGTIKDTGPYRAALFYALDRYDASPAVWEDLRNGSLVVSNRYVGSNMGHQGSKIESAVERAEFFKWVYELEYGILGIPKPAVNVFLHVPAETAYELVAQKADRAYLKGAKRDIHEADMDHLRRAEETYEVIVRMFPEEFLKIECAPLGNILPPEEIHEKVWSAVEKFLQ